MSAEEETSSGKNGKASKLIDAAIWIFAVTGLSIVTSVFFVSGLSSGLHFDFPTYFGIKDYLEVTPYWLGPPLSAVFGLIILCYPLRYVKGDVLPLKQWLPWLRHKLRVRHWLLVTSIVFVVAGFALTLVSRFLFSPPLFLADLMVIVAASVIYYAAFFLALNPKFRKVLGGTLVEKVASQPFLRLGVTLVLTVGVYAYILGIIWEPVNLWTKPISTIHVADSNSEVRGRVTF
jgi:hypothetical protein